MSLLMKNGWIAEIISSPNNLGLTGTLLDAVPVL